MQQYKQTSKAPAKGQEMQIDSGNQQPDQFKKVQIDNLYDLLFTNSQKMKSEENLSKNI